MKDIWTAQVHLLTPPAEHGDTKAWANVVAWAEDAEDFAATISAIFARRHWSILDIQQCMPAAECKAMIAELAQQVEEARLQPGSCIFGTLQYYPSRRI
jgi:hypothetical protein